MTRLETSMQVTVLICIAAAPACFCDLKLMSANSQGQCTLLLTIGSVVEEGLQWDVKVNSSNDIRSQQVNRSLAAMLTLRSGSSVLSC